MSGNSATQQTGDHGLSVLVVDDNEGFRDILTLYLTHQGVRVDCADDGLSGLNKYRDNPKKYDAVLLDIQMPVMDGYEALRLIRETETGKSVPVLAMSGQTDEEKSTGFDRCLRKPFPFEELIPTILDAVVIRRNEGTR